MKHHENYRIPVRIGSQIIGWLYPIIPSEDPSDTNDYTVPVLVYVENRTKRG